MNQKLYMYLHHHSCFFYQSRFKLNASQNACIHSYKRSQTKGQIKSEWIYEIINFSKNYLKNLKDFCYKNSQGRNPSNF